MSGSREPEWDQLSIETPELVGIDMPVAGIGSRFVALLVDYLIWLLASVGFVLLVGLVDPSLSHFGKIGEKWAIAIFTMVVFLWFWGYFTLFEAFWNGRTPGKRLAKIRVIQRSGRGIGIVESMIRNLIRVVDQFPFVYAVGAVSIFVTREHQRLGDLAAGTLVVHERENLSESSSGSSTRTLTVGVFETAASRTDLAGARRAGMELAPDGMQKLEIGDLEVLEGFFARRLDFSMEVRAALAQRIAEAIRGKTGLEAPAGVDTESFLEEIARRFRDVARMQ
ncbi:MAG TPA: RDD family protein [Acidobacteriaceae bacterium]|nr:RDD family protein [Acidobacteriaceae bacterium]